MVYIWCMKICGRQFWSTEVNPGVCLVDGNKWSAVLVYGGQFGCMFGAWKNMAGNVGLSMSNRVYVWCMELYGRQFCLWRPTRVYVWCMELMVGSFRVWRSTRQVWKSSMVYAWCMKLCGRQFWSTEVNPVVFCYIELDVRRCWSMEVNSGVCLVHGILW